MFISFGMYIGLIILTILMIALLIYLTMTSSNGLSSVNKFNPEEEAKERLAQNSKAMASSHAASFNQENSTHDQPDNFSGSTQEFNSTKEHNGDDASFHVLPYPKDDSLR